MPVLWFGLWPRLFMRACIAIACAAPIAPIEILCNIVSGDYPGLKAS